MPRTYQVAILSDVHYASASERARGDDYESRTLKNPFTRMMVVGYRRYIWLKHPLGQNQRLDEFLSAVGKPDWVIANGDYCGDTEFVGLSDDASFQSARECLSQLRDKFSPNFRANLGDHELGKMSLMGKRGGMRLASWHRAINGLGLEPLWRVELGNYVLLGVTSSLLALKLFAPDLLDNERAEWQRLADEHLSAVRAAFAALKPQQRVILFIHDPSALPFLWREEIIRAKLPQVEQTIIGHLHSNLVFWQSRLLAGMPPIHFLGHSIKRMSTALSEGRYWRDFKVRLCPSLAGIELLKDGGYYTMELDEDAQEPARFKFHRLKR